MTGTEWWEATHPFQMLQPDLRGRIPNRKLRLFVVGCCRLHRTESAPEWVDELLDLAEQAADGRGIHAAVRSRFAQVAELYTSLDNLDGLMAHPYDALGWDDAFFAAVLGIPQIDPASAVELLRCIVGNPFPRTAPVRPRLGTVVLSALARLMGGSPHQPAPPDVEPLPEPPFDPSWRTEVVVALARGIYDDRAFNRLPVLADALEDSGCADSDILEHCRRGGPHARGCWVVDAVLGKE